MRFTKIRLTGLTAIEFPIVGALPTDPYILKAADGLGPPEVDVSIVDTLNAGGYYQGRRPQNREVVLRVGLNPDYGSDQTAADLRTVLYGMLTPGSSDSVLLEIINNTTVLATTTGYLKKLEIVPFSKDTEVQLTIACTSPYLQAVDRLYVDPGSTSAPAINNVGTAPTGFKMSLQFTTALASWSLTDAAGKKIEFVHDFLANDILTFDTRAGSRTIELTRDLVTTKIIAALTSDSMWLSLYGGNNVFATSDPNFTWGDVYYLPQYWGI